MDREEHIIEQDKEEESSIGDETNKENVEPQEQLTIEIQSKTRKRRRSEEKKEEGNEEQIKLSMKETMEIARTVDSICSQFSKEEAARFLTNLINSYTKAGKRKKLSFEFFLAGHLKENSVIQVLPVRRVPAFPAHNIPNRPAAPSDPPTLAELQVAYNYLAELGASLYTWGPGVSGAIKQIGELHLAMQPVTTANLQQVVNAAVTAAVNTAVTAAMAPYQGLLNNLRAESKNRAAVASSVTQLAPMPLAALFKTQAGAGPRLRGQSVLHFPQGHPFPVGQAIPSPPFPATTAAAKTINWQDLNVLAVVYNETFGIDGVNDDIEAARRKFLMWAQGLN